MSTYIYPKSFGSNPDFPKKADFTIHKTSRSKGLGVLTKKSFKSGDLVAKITGPEISEIKQHTLQIRKGVHLHDTYFSGYFLHSCEPNISVDMKNMEVRALKNIKKNSYLYMDYSETEDYLYRSFKCNCGSPNCRKVIRGKKDKNLIPASLLGDPESMLYKKKSWWERTDLGYRKDQLHIGKNLVKDLVGQADIPTFYYLAPRIKDNITRIHEAFQERGLGKRSKIFYAMKANRFAPVLSYLRFLNLCGIDACSPQEVEHAISCGFQPSEISFTATSLSKSDFFILSKYKDLIINCDSITTLKQCIKYGLTRSLGVRINPEVGISRSDNEKLQYTGKKLSKFGIYIDQLAEFTKVARQNNVKIKTLHFHTGCGYLTENLDQLDTVFAATKPFIEALPDLQNVNIGGGLGVPHGAREKPLDLEKWMDVIFKHFGKSKFNIHIEPGEYIVKDSGILLLEKTYQEKKKDKQFIGLNAGFNVALEPAFYKLPFEPAILERYHGKFTNYTIVGNINEALDVWFENFMVEDLTMHTHLALINAGAYSSSMSSNHCMRGAMREVLLMQ